MPSVGFEPTISAGERPLTYAFDRAATGSYRILDEREKGERERGERGRGREKGERERERGRETKEVRVYFRRCGRNVTTLEGSDAWPARPYRRVMQMNALEW